MHPSVPYHLHLRRVPKLVVRPSFFQLLQRVQHLALVPVVRSSCPEATIVVLTGLSSLRVQTEAYAAGADFFVEKSMSARNLVQKIAELVVTG